MSIAGKVVARVLLIRLQATADRVYPKSPCCFRAGRSTTDMIVTVRQLQEKSREQGKPLHLAFIDPTKAIDLVIRKGLFQLLEKIGCSSTLINQWLSPTTNASWAPCMKSGVKQGCVLAPTLFGIFFSSSCPMSLTLPLTVCTQSIPATMVNSSGWLSSSPRPKSKLYLCMMSMLFADDAALATHPERAMQRPINKFGSKCENFGLTESASRKSMWAWVPWMSAKPLKSKSATTLRFNHLHMNSSFDSEISRRISKAPAPCPNWKKRAWKKKYLTENTKMYIYIRHAFSAPCSAAVNLDHLNETERRLNSFHLRCLRRILGVKWQDHITNSEISPACPPFAASAAWDGSDMFIAWMMDASPRKFYSDNWKQESGKPGAQPCGSWKLTNVTSKHAKLIQAIGTMLLVNVPAGDGQWKKESRMQASNLVLQSALGFC